MTEDKKPPVNHAEIRRKSPHFDEWVRARGGDPKKIEKTDG